MNTEPNTTEGILSIDPIDMNELPTGTLREMLAAGDVVANCHRVLSNTGDNIVGELIKDAGTFYEWQHYPDGDVYDRGTHAQYYYHAHLKEERIGEHGHFHTFLRPKVMPKNVHPSRAVPDYRSPREDNEALSHLIAVSMDRQGFPIRLFTTNRWVTGEFWYRASDVVRMVERFQIDHAQPSWPVNMWISAMLTLFSPQIRALILQRDVAVAQWQRLKKPDNVYEDRSLEVTSEVAIEVDQQVEAIRAALAGRPKE